MKRNLPFYSLLTAIPVGLLILVGFSGGQPGEFSGSPGDGGTTCTQCHSPGTTHGGTPVLTNVPTFYNAGQSYDLNLAINGSSVSKFGFNITAESAGGVSQGTWDITGGSGTRLRNDGNGLTHSGSGNSQNNWTLRWTAPTTTGQGQIPVTFYYATIQANNANGNRNDQMVSGQSTAVLTTPDVKISDFKLYPTRTINDITIELVNANEARLLIYNMSGLLVNNITISNAERVDVSHLASGTYISQVNVNGQVSTQKFVKY